VTSYAQSKSTVTSPLPDRGDPWPIPIKNTGAILGVGQLDGVPITFDKLEAAHISWNVYTDDAAPLEFSVSWGSRQQWGSAA
jgi:hypothetical protein